MIRFLFHRESFVVRMMEILGVFFSILYLRQNLADFDWRAGLFLLLLLQYLFVRVCDLVNWYPKAERENTKKIGIQVHFQKALVPTSFILAITSFLGLMSVPYVSTGVLIFSILLMLVVAPVNGILLYFHFRDKDTLPMNFFSLNTYLKLPASDPS